MAAVEISVLIPTFNRAVVLERTLTSLAGQKVSAACEILIIDDGSSDATAEVVAGFQGRYACPLLYLRQSHRGPAAARNLGLKNAGGEIIVMIGDDIIPASDGFLEEHLRWHRALHPEPQTAVLGLTAWDPELTVTPFMRWLETSGLQFDYNGLRQGDFAGHRRFYTSNLSVKKSFLRGELFDEQFSHAVIEDLEFGYRLHQRGLKLAFNRQALAYHRHAVDLEGYCRRASLTGQSAAVCYSLHPELEDCSAGFRLKLLAMRAFFNAFTIALWLPIVKFFEKRWAPHFLFLGVYGYYHFKAYRRQSNILNRCLRDP